MKTTLLLGFSLLSITAFSQIDESFADGNFTADPVWSGDNAKWQFVSVSDVFSGNTTVTNSIRSVPSNSAETSYLSTSVAGDWGAIQTWGFWTGRLDRAFDNNNKNIFWLWASQANLKSATINGYRIRIGDASLNKIFLEKVVNGVATVLVSSAGNFAGVKNIGFAIRVTRNNGQWTVFSSALPTANSTGIKADQDPKDALVTSINQGTANDMTYTDFSNGYFGIAAVSNHNKSEVEFDQISLTLPLPLPVSLKSFSTILGNNNFVDLKWTTIAERDVSYFLVEKSSDGQKFSEVGLVFANGNSNAILNYTFTDKNINTSGTGLIYYRLRSVDIDGKSQVSVIRMVTIGKQIKDRLSIITYPNPVSNELRITIPDSWQGKSVIFEILKHDGRAVKRKVSMGASQTESIAVNDLAPGFYVLRAINNGEIIQQQIIKR